VKSFSLIHLHGETMLKSLTILVVLILTFSSFLSLWLLKLLYFEVFQLFIGTEILIMGICKALLRILMPLDYYGGSY
jgi:hypothetical protein